MKQWEEKDLKFLNNNGYFPNCIECSDHYLDFKRRDYFHKKDCDHGHGRDNWEVINERLNERLEAFEKRYGVNGVGIQCSECENMAVGTMHVFFHGTTKTVDEWPVCMDHAFHEDIVGRETQFRGF